MIVLLQRVGEARVDVDGRTFGTIAHGLLAFVCAVDGDVSADADRIAVKCARLRIFEDASGRMNRSVADVGGAVLAVSQFTLAADASRGNRPSFSAAAPPPVGETLYERFCHALQAEGLTVAKGRFGARMAVHLVNDGPVTIWLDSRR